MNRRSGAWIAACGALGVLSACGGTPDLVREEKLADESHSPAEQYRILGSGKFLTSDYFIERAKPDGDVAPGTDPGQTKKTEELGTRVLRLEQQAKGGGSPESQPVKPAPKPAVAPIASGADAEQIKTRLRLLIELKKEGLITEQEYQEKRQEILKGL